MNHPLSAVIVAAVLTGSGGGIIRDLLAGRKPIVLRSEIYGVWAILAGVIIGLKIATKPWELYTLFMLVTSLRVLSYTYDWKLPSRGIRTH
jgi:uncharacterized membrane protein YeiH